MTTVISEKSDRPGPFTQKGHQEVFPVNMTRVVPWVALAALIQPRVRGECRAIGGPLRLPLKPTAHPPLRSLWVFSDSVEEGWMSAKSACDARSNIRSDRLRRRSATPKVRYEGLEKNIARPTMLLAPGELWMLRWQIQGAEC